MCAVNAIAKWTVIRHSLSCSRFFLKMQENQMLNSERTAGPCNFSPDTHPVKVFWQGYRVIGVTGTKAMAMEWVVDQKVRIQSICFPKLGKTFASLFGALFLPELLPHNPLITFFPSPGTTGRMGCSGGVFPKQQAIKKCKNC